MIQVEAWSEPTKINDKETGKAVFVSTTARITFRKAFPKAQKVRNSILNIAIATIFSSLKTSSKFKPKSDHFNYAHGQSGVVREVGGGKFIAIVGDNWIKIVTFKGAPPQLDLPDIQQTNKNTETTINAPWQGGDPLMVNPAPSSDVKKDNRGPAGSAADALLSAINK
jgi:hypothetical protein